MKRERCIDIEIYIYLLNTCVFVIIDLLSFANIPRRTPFTNTFTNTFTDTFHLRAPPWRTNHGGDAARAPPLASGAWETVKTRRQEVFVKVFVKVFARRSKYNKYKYIYIYIFIYIYIYLYISIVYQSMYIHIHT